MSLPEIAKDLDKTLSKAASLLEKYMSEGAAEAAKSGRDDAAGGMSPAQLRQRLQAFVIAKLSPKPRFGFPKPPIQLDGAPEARRFIEARGFPGLAR
jgi:hypothetical protein